MFGRLKIGPGRYPDGVENVSPRGGNMGEVMVSQMQLTRGELALRGQAFIYHMASQAILLTATTGGHPTVINPIGSGVLWYPTRLALGWISGATVIGSVLWAETANVGNGPATASALLTATLVAPVSARRVNTGQPKTLWSPTTNTFTAAPTVRMAAGISLGTSSPLSETPYVDYNGEICLEPGNALSLVYSVTTSTALFQITICGVEIPIMNVS